MFLALPGVSKAQKVPFSKGAPLSKIRKIATNPTLDGEDKDQGEAALLGPLDFLFLIAVTPMRMKKGTTCLGPLDFLFVIVVTPMRMTLSGE